MTASGTPYGRIPPHDLDAEGVVLSSILLLPEALDTVRAMLRPEHFYSEANRRIMEAAYALDDAHQPIDMVRVSSWLREHDKLASVGGSSYIAEVTEATPATAHIEAHAATLVRHWRRRQTISICQRYYAEGFGPQEDEQAFYDGLEASLAEVIHASPERSLQPVGEIYGPTYDGLRRNQLLKLPSGISTRWGDVDQLIGGLHPGDLYIVAGRPGMGKTSWAMSMMLEIARPRPPTPGGLVAFFSLEMPKEQIAIRAACSEGRVATERVRKNRLSAEDWIKLEHQKRKLLEYGLWVDDTPAISVAEIRARLRQLRRDIHAGRIPTTIGQRPKDEDIVVVVDYLQLMTGRGQSREQEIAGITRDLKELAKSERVPVMAVSQLNRSVETRPGKDKRPQLSDLRESGAIEQDADCVIFIYRESYYDRDAPDTNLAEAIVAKQRNGPTGTIEMHFDRSTTRFFQRDVWNSVPSSASAGAEDFGIGDGFTRPPVGTAERFEGEMRQRSHDFGGGYTRDPDEER